jgi:hypothetical protein
MRQITRWMLAVLALAGFNGVVAQAQNHHGSTSSDHMNALNAGTLDLGSYEHSDGSTMP